MLHDGTARLTSPAQSASKAPVNDAGGLRGVWPGCSVVHNEKIKNVRIVVTDAEAGLIQIGKLEG